MKQRLLQNRALELLVLLGFSLAYIVVAIYHEPWFDEAQAWEIARGASVKEIFLVLPHYEGHPPLWHLILMIPARLGIPFEVGLKSIGAIISILSVIILLFRSSLPRVIRLSIPFTYFFFYQYGVIVRPYALMLLVMIVLGITLHCRKEHPWRVIVLLGILCLCSAYGIVIAGGISICFAYEYFKEKRKIDAITVLREQRVVSLLFLLVFAIFLISGILPKTDTFYPVYDEQNSFIVCFLCALFTFPAECFLTSSGWFYVDQQLLQTVEIPVLELIVLCIIGIVVWFFFICFASKENLKYLIVPYLLIALFASKVYFTSHHIGVVFILFLFWTEVCYRDVNRYEVGRLLVGKIVSKKTDFMLIKRFFQIMAFACLIVPIIWSAIASINDMRYDYYYGRSVSDFLKNTNLSELNILGNWSESGSMAPLSLSDENYVNTVMIGTAVPINAYFGKNIFYNLNLGDSKAGFMYHRRPSHAEADQDINIWKSYGNPDVIIGKPDLKLVFGKELSYAEYSLVNFAKTKFIWKSSVTSGGISIFLRNDLLDKYGLTPLDDLEYSLVKGFKITDEMKQRYEAGEPVENIINPYLNAIYGDE